MRGITFEFGKDYAGNETLLIKKARGKLAVSEITELLLHEANGLYNGHWVIYINAAEADGIGWGDDYESKGDAIMLMRILEQESCPVCGKLTPPFEYCPHCGMSWNSKKE